jgi:hypothetical protein
VEDAKIKGGAYEYFDSEHRKGLISSSARSNFAFLSRGIRRPLDRENAIEGSEFIIFQVEPFEVLGFQRLILYYFGSSGNRVGDFGALFGR